MNVFTESLRVVWQHPTSVHLDEAALVQFARRIEDADLVTPSWREPVFPETDSTDFTDFLGVGNSINFAFRHFQTKQRFLVEYRGTEWSGAYAMWACLARALDDGIDILDGAYLACLTIDDMRGLFRGTTPLQFLEERLQILRDVGLQLSHKYEGRFHRLFSAAGYRAFGREGIINRLIREFPTFNDTSVHKATGQLLQFHKRAQLFAMMYQGRALESSELEKLADYKDLGPIADYVVPRSLNRLGVLRYESELQETIESEKPIPKDSVWEQEIRVQSTYAQVRLLDLLHEFGHIKATTLNIDYLLWTLGRGGSGPPPHLTETSAY